jgi:hypothetical protein
VLIVVGSVFVALVFCAVTVSKKGEAFQRKRHPDDRAGFFHKTWPEQTELERKLRSRHGAHRKKNGCAARPSFAQFRKLELDLE